MTVPPDATIGSKEPRHARVTASHFRSPSAIASRNRAT